MKRYSWLLLLFFTACNNQKKESPSETKKAVQTSSKEENNSVRRGNDDAAEATTNSDADILNNISLHETGGLKVAQAYLAFEDGKLVPKTNETDIGTPVYLTLLIDRGWEIKDQQASIDATEIITTHDGEIVLNAPNLFKNSPTLDATDANRILLKANITRTRPDIRYFVVNYRVWDKWSDAEVKGSYRLYVSNTSVTPE
jgi:hypothetical protein